MYICTSQLDYDQTNHSMVNLKEQSEIIENNK